MRIKLAPQVRGAVGNSKSNSNRTELMPGEQQHQHRDNSYLLLSLCLMFYLFDLKLKPHLSSQVDQAQDERYAICTSSPHLDVLQLTDVPVIGYNTLEQISRICLAVTNIITRRGFVMAGS